MKWFRLLAASVLVSSSALVQAGPDEEYVGIYQMIEEADQLNANNQVNQARSRFAQVQAALNKFKATYPAWNTAAVDFRLQYVTDKLKQLGGGTAEPAKAPVTKAAPADPLEELRATVTQLQEERRVLQAKLQEALAAQPAAVDPRELQKAEAQIVALQKEKELLRVALEQEQGKTAQAAEKSGLEKALQENAALRSQLAAGAAPTVAMERELAAAREIARTNAAAVAGLQAALKDMQAQRDAVLARAVAADRAATETKSAGNKTAKPTDKEIRQLEILRARLEVLEARKVPYTPEEQALFKQPALTAKAAPARTESKRKELPAGAGVLLTEAQRFFATRQFEKAEQKYLEVLKMDDQNVFTLANLGAIQLEMGRLADAEATLKKAQAIDAGDSFVLSTLGIVRFRQNNFEEAFDLLSRAVEMDPKNHEAYNYLGITLSQKGQRAAAETALRKAIEINPNSAGAHYNLAVVYATQQPPFLEMARFHYQKALNLGHPPSAEVEKMVNRPKG